LDGVLRRRPEPPLIPAPLRRPAIVAVLVAATVFALLAVRYAGGSSARWLDDRGQWLADDLIPRGGGHLVVLGSPPAVVTLAVLLAVACLWLGQRRLAVVAIVGPGLTGLLTTLAKPLVGRTIEGEFAYPSGHTGGATALGLVAALLLARLLRPAPARAGLLVAAGGLLAGGTVGTVVVALDWHYATDAVGGFLVAVAAVLGSALLVDAVLDRRPASYPRRG
jgi:membrane-associated phospholipid phosphatase